MARLPGSDGYHRGSWRHALMASVWSAMPAMFGHAALGSRALHDIPLCVNFTNTNGNGNRTVGASVTFGGDNATSLFLRRGRTTGRPPDTPREADAEGDVQTDVSTESAVSGNKVLRAFDRWAEENSGCGANEFMQGVRQSYYGLGVLCETLAEAAKPQLPVGKVVSLAGALAQLKGLLTKQYAISPKDLADEVKNIAEKSGKEGRRTSKVVAEALRQILPISLELGERMYNMWNKQRVFDSNVLRIAAPNDYILSSNMVFFHECHNMKETHFMDDVQLAVIVSSHSPDAEKWTGRAPDITSDSSARSTPEQEMKPAVKSSMTAGEGLDVGSTEGGKQLKGQTIITFRGRQLPRIPATAKACVVASIDVVTPPQRYDHNFDWYYQRIRGYESEYQRIAVARFFAMSNAQAVLAPLDFLVRMCTGRHLELACPPGISDMIGIPKNIAECPPAMRKLLCYYMDADGRWVLSDLLWVDTVTTPMMPKTASA
ncbi:hypothetical protein TraAM80_05102 [Trypanosoma rangeli]|uniref:Uncharacterized protein n=1 Tax=Trypanosoma rangeli TaxID=5698 RepID=A0A3R7LW60_TRYRA|nr:uncharacterized protein TraAM80_05102 [Trypanosoma rangeli]RNF04510.1 hypothetical protein TraAM80_05102 [Trypanosoma rangeli]|eukprot:RNF04510.1 hypothetical protein TraAM80_05102 [Trypanosoma rangeli]